MSLTFLAPLFLLGVAAVAVPIIVHLVNRERRNAVAFPSLMFLRRVPFKSMRRQRIRHRALFALRCLALALLALAFARPFVDREAGASGTGGAGPRELVVLLDRSYSMAYGDRWSRATAAAERAVAGMGAADRATLVLFDDEAASAAGPTGEKAIVTSAIRKARPGAGSTRYAPALSVAQQLMERSERPRREVVLISDFQRSGWDGQELPKLAAPAALTTVDVGDSSTANTLVTSVDVSRDARDGVDRATVAARVATQGEGLPGTAQATLELNGRVVETKQLPLPGSGATSVTFAPVPVPEGNTRGTVRVAASDRLPVDDVFHFVIGAAQVVSVLLVESPSAPISRTMFLPRALGIGDRPSFSVVQRRSDQVTAADVDAARVVILNGAAIPGGTAGERIRGHVNRGGGLIVALGENGGGRALSGASGLLPGTIGGIIDRSAERGGTMGTLDRNHSALESFRGSRSGDFTSTRYLRYRSLSPAPTDAVLARFDDGSVALAERRVGEGTVVAFSSTFDGYWNDLPVQPVFLPLIQSLVRHAANWTPQPPWETVGSVLSVPAPSARDELVAVAPSGARTRWSETDSVRSLGLREQGFYEIRGSASAGGTRTIAVNANTTESELGRFPPDELARAVTPDGIAVAGSAPATTLSIAEREKRQTMWWYVLVIALLLLAAESLLSNRLSRAARRDVSAANGRLENA
jgi:hypothetical protein